MGETRALYGALMSLTIDHGADDQPSTVMDEHVTLDSLRAGARGYAALVRRILDGEPDVRDSLTDRSGQ